MLVPPSFHPRRNGSSERECAADHRSGKRSDVTVLPGNRRHKDTNGVDTFPPGMSSPEPCFLEAASLGPEERNPINQSNAYMRLAKQMSGKVGGRGGAGAEASQELLPKEKRSKNSANYKLVRLTTTPTIIRKYSLQ